MDSKPKITAPRQTLFRFSKYLRHIHVRSSRFKVKISSHESPYLALIICRKTCKKPYFEMLCFKFAVGNVHKDYIPNQKLLKKPNFVYFVENLLHFWKPLLLRKLQLKWFSHNKTAHVWKKIKCLVPKQLWEEKVLNKRTKR